MKPSVRVISERTGFSTATVSNALNKKRGVNKVTSAKIFKVAKELGYNFEEKINKVRFVIFRRNGLIIDDTNFHPAVIEGVERQAEAMGYSTVFNYVDVNQEEYMSKVNEILNDSTSAVILLGTEMLETDFKPYLNARNRLVLLDGWSDEHFFDSVLISNTDSACKAAEYLIDKGHVDIGYIRGDFRIQAFKYREVGLVRALERGGLTINKNHWATVGTKIETAYEGMKEYLNKTDKMPTAFLADNDIIAIGAMRALKEKGYSIPEDVSIVGFDDIPFVAASEPPLTTVRVYKQEMGEIAARKLLTGLEEGERKRRKMRTKTQVCTKFVERDSVKELK